MTTFTLNLPGDLDEAKVQEAVDIAVAAVANALAEAGFIGGLAEVKEEEATEEEAGG